MPGRVLMVAFHYPPSGAVAAQRPHKFARYLPDNGWVPGVVARSPDPRQPRDDSFAGPPVPAEIIDPGVPWMPPIRRFFCVPDAEPSWRRALERRLPGAIALHRPDIVWANSVPLGSLVVAARAARRAGLPFFADFHNEWTRNPYYRPPTRGRDALHRRLEREVVESARVVVTLNPLHTEDLRSRFPSVRVETIENGCDPDDYPVDPPDPARRPLVFLYAGAVYGHQGPSPFLRALAATGRRDVEVRIVGDRFGAFEPGRWPFPVRAEGHLAHRDLGAAFSAASAFFLCLDAPAARQLPAKVYEYLRAGRPVFAIAPRDGAAARWIRSTGAGVAVDSEEPDRWAAALSEFIEGLTAWKAPPFEPYLRSRQAGRLAALLDEVRR